MHRTPSIPEPRRTAPEAAAEDEERTARLAQLLAAAHLDDVRAFACLYRLTSQRLLAIVRRIQRDRAEADDVLQDVYLKIWNARHQFDGGRGRVEPWLAGIARNCAIDSLRRAGRRPSLSGAAPDVDVYASFASPDPGPLDQVLQAEADRSLWTCMRQLGAEQRRCLFQAYWHDLSQDEIARLTGHPLGTVKSWMRRSLATLHGSLTALQA